MTEDRDEQGAKEAAMRDHRSLVLSAADCAERVLPCFEEKYPEDNRPRNALEAARAWARGEMALSEVRAAAFAAHAAARAAAAHAAACGAARAAGHAAATAHVATHAAHAAHAATYAATGSLGAGPGLTARECGRCRSKASRRPEAGQEDQVKSEDLSPPRMPQRTPRNKI